MPSGSVVLNVFRKKGCFGVYCPGPCGFCVRWKPRYPLGSSILCVVSLKMEWFKVVAVWFDWKVLPYEVS